MGYRAGLPAKRRQPDAYDADYDRGKQKKVRGQGGHGEDAWQDLGSPGSNMFESAWQSRSGGGGGGRHQRSGPGSSGRKGRGGRGGGGRFRGHGSSPGRGRRGGGFRGGRGGR